MGSWEAISSTATNITAVTKALVYANAAQVRSFYIGNANAAIRYFQLHNKASAAPVATEVPLLSFLIPIGQGLVIPGDVFSEVERFTTGLGWAVSTTANTFTDAATGAEHPLLLKWRAIA